MPIAIFHTHMPPLSGCIYSGSYAACSYRCLKMSVLSPLLYHYSLSLPPNPPTPTTPKNEIKQNFNTYRRRCSTPGVSFTSNDLRSRRGQWHPVTLRLRSCSIDMLPRKEKRRRLVPSSLPSWIAQRPDCARAAPSTTRYCANTVAAAATMVEPSLSVVLGMVPRRCGMVSPKMVRRIRCNTYLRTAKLLCCCIF